MSAREEPWADRLLRVLRRTLATIVGVQLAIAIGMSLVDSYRRRGKKPGPFPVTPPRRMPFYPLRQPVAAAAITCYRIKDRLGLPS